MIFRVIRLFVLSSCILFYSQVSAKDQYKAEVGIMGGGSFYIGDANAQLFKNMQAAYGGFFRYKLNPRVAFKIDLQSTSVGGTFTTATNTYTFAKQFTTGDVVAEVNFFDFEKTIDNRRSKNFSPYIYTGIGGVNGLYSNKGFPEFCIPFGIGVKIKLADRWNLNIQWANKLLLADNIERNVDPSIPSDLNNPTGLNGSNIFNNDLLTTLSIGVSLDIWKKSCNCNNLLHPAYKRKK